MLRTKLKISLKVEIHQCHLYWKIASSLKLYPRSPSIELPSYTEACEEI